MISNNDLLAIKERLLVSAAAARRLIDSNEPTIHYDEEEYWRVHISFSQMQSDVTLLLTELDTFRAMFADRVNDFLTGGGLDHAVNVSSGDRENAGDSVGGVPDGASVSSGDTPQPDEAAVSSALPARRIRRRRAQMPQPDRDQGGLPATPEAVD